MFTGIIESTGIIKKIENSKLSIQAPFLSKLEIGQSIAHDGVCLTVTKILDDCYEVELIPETFKRSHFQNIQEGYEVNLERCMKADGRFDGHIVQGHTDFVGVIEGIEKDGNSSIFKIIIPEEYSNYFVEKGSVTLNGISLTVIFAEKHYFTVGIIPHTMELTNLRNITIDSKVNVETDIVGKYIKKFNSTS
ncbi:riboflavin synthase [Candidatus Peregrinibacteria bacterium]|jgi:riboflavin synthase|nr:riboflavin synthase [Candidatus Peregrinibacteria bacterium]